MTRRGPVLLAAIALGCRPSLDVNHDGKVVIACVGDSNSYAFVPGNWCERVRQRAQERRWSVDTVSQLGAMVGDPGILPAGLRWGDGGWLLHRALRRHPDVVMIALGTNDARIGRPPKEIVEGLAAMVARAERVHARTYVALVPPMRMNFADRNPKIARLNALLTARLPGRTLDFASPMTPADYDPDGVHLSAAGHAKRADVAWAVLRDFR